MSKNFEDFMEKFRILDYTIYKTKYWTWSVRPIHTTIGSGILSMNRAIEKFGDMTQDEGADLARMVKIIENTLGKAFEFKRINYIMYMMVDYQVHYHVIPRYDRDIIYNGMIYKDKNWPEPPIINGENHDEKQLISIRDYLRENIITDN